MHGTFRTRGYVNVTKDGASGYDESWRMLEVVSIDVEIFVLVHVNGEALCGETQCKGEAVVVWLHFAFLDKGVAEYGFALGVVSCYVAIDFGECADVRHVAW